MEETLCGRTFRLSVPSFFQINRAQTERLYGLVLDLAQLSGKETVLDLYCGIGTISLVLARSAKISRIRLVLSSTGSFSSRPRLRI